MLTEPRVQTEGPQSVGTCGRELAYSECLGLQLTLCLLEPGCPAESPFPPNPSRLVSKERTGTAAMQLSLHGKKLGEQLPADLRVSCLHWMLTLLLTGSVFV